MLSAKTAGFVAIGSSTGALCLVLFYLPALITKISDIKAKLRVDSDEFRVMADEAWVQIVEVKAIPVHLRTRRQAYGEQKGYGEQRQTYGEQRNSRRLRGGPPGLRGEPGAIGLPGIVPPTTQDYNQGCRVCPQGPRGPTGSPGEVGPPGSEGAQGPKGRAGEDGRPGYAGNPGNIGEAGIAGKPGEQGSAGQRRNSRSERAARERRAEPESRGRKAPQAMRGGQDGAPGAITVNVGAPGEDATYCPCPNRSNGVNKPSNSYEPAPQPSTYAPAPNYEPAPIEAESQCPYHRLVKIEGGVL
ncbi:Col-cuticle-N domain-containing protein [Aphelenchoides fujianensis]|nr:Col-cuticle-N domain-containing protein [Aphelenchoides fujianensis]